MMIQADARRIPLADGCVDCVVTSPPYFGLRDYGAAKQIGLELTPDDYVAALVAVFADVWRVLKDAGTVWLNLGDSYAAGGKGGGGSFMAERREAAWQQRSSLNGWRRQPEGMKQKDLIGIPWMVAFALRADGWYLRSDIIWSKLNPMPESVTDRPTKAHEYVFLLSKSERYFYDADAIREPVADSQIGRARDDVVGGAKWDERGQHSRGGRYVSSGAASDDRKEANDIGQATTEDTWWLGHRTGDRSAPMLERGCHETYTGQATKDYATAGAQNPSDTKRRVLAAMADPEYAGRNKRTVWTIPTMPYAGAHFATMPEALVEPCILAGCPLGGLVLDPFLGSGTVGAVAERLGRRWVGLDLNPSYLALAKQRTAQRGLMWGASA